MTDMCGCGSTCPPSTMSSPSAADLRGPTTLPRLQLRHLSAGCGRSPHATAVCRSDNGDTLVAYAAGKLIVIYDVEQGLALTALRGHTHSINAVCWLPTTTASGTHHQHADGTHYLFSGGVDAALHIWRYSRNSPHTYQLVQTLASSNSTTASIGAITATTVNVNDQQSVAVVTWTTSDGCVHIATKSLSNNESTANADTPWQLHQSIAGTRSVLAVAMQPLTAADQSHTPLVLLSAAGVTNKIALYAAITSADPTQPLSQFAPIISLEGHTDWIRCLDFCALPSSTQQRQYLLASASQDKTIRLWRFTHSCTATTSNTPSMSLTTIGSRAHRLKYSTAAYSGEVSIALESVLHGHENWVLSARWAATAADQQTPALLSASTDKALLLWEHASDSNLWLISTRVGEQGGHTLGFYGAHIIDSQAQQCRYLFANGYSGSLHLWREQAPQSNVYTPAVTISGHSAPVTDLAWDSAQTYLTSVSSDQTARCYAEWQDNHHWYEIARPQVHGYDLNCIAPITGPYKHLYASGAAEKVIRVFYAPVPFLHTLKQITGADGVNDDSTAVRADSPLKRAARAHIPELGLSNKAHATFNAAVDAYLIDDEKQPPDSKSIATLSEDFLISHTLWPEVDKLYGHGYEVLCLAANRSGTLLASASAAKQAQHAAVRLWNTSDWTELTVLPAAHSLSVVQMEFSHRGSMLLTVSRDRHLALFRMPSQADALQPSNNDFQLLAKVKAHARIIWSCSWSADDQYIATGARDKLVKVWRVNHQVLQQADGAKSDGALLTEVPALPVFACAVTAVAFAPRLHGDSYLLAVGLEDGQIELWLGSKAGSSLPDLKWSQLAALPPNLRHADVVRRLVWRQPSAATATLQLASCSDDHTVRIFDVAMAAL